MKYNPYISFVVTSYNYDQYISQTLDSILAQSYKNFEVIVVDDGSTDNSLKIIEQYIKKDNRIKLYQHENGQNKGLPASVALGVKKAKGEFIAFCESDDYLAQDYLEEKINYINLYPKADIVANKPEIFGYNAKRKEEEFSRLFSILDKVKEPKNLYFWLWTYVGLVFPTFSIMMIRTSALRTCDFNPQGVPSAIDIWLWRQLLCFCKVGFVDKKLTFWRMHPKSLSKTSVGLDKWEIFYKNLNNKIRFPWYFNWAKNISGIQNYIFQKKITKHNSLIIKFFKIPIFYKRNVK